MASMSIRILLSCRTSSLLRSPFFCIHFSSHPPSAPNPQTPKYPISNFLLTECDFSPTQISKIMRRAKSLSETSSPYTAREAVQFLKKWGFTQPQLHTVILGYPSVLESKVETEVKPKFRYLRTLGFTDQDCNYLITNRPRVLGLTLESDIIPKMSFLENLFGTKRNLVKAVKAAPALLDDSIEKNLKPKLDLFKQWGIHDESLSFLLSNDPCLFGRCSLEILRERMEYATKTMGIFQGSKQFIYAISVFVGNPPQTVEKKMKHSQCLGLPEDEVRVLWRKNPWLLAHSPDKMQENMDFLTQTAGLKPNVVFSNPILLQQSVKKRLMPRYAVFKALLSLDQQSVPSLVTILSLNERSFLEKIVKCHPQASMLKEIYKGIPESSNK